MPRFDTDEQHALCSVFLVSAQHEDWSNLSYRSIHENHAVLRLTREPPTPVILRGLEFQHLPVFFYITAVLPIDGYTRFPWHHSGNTVVSVTVCRLEPRPGSVGYLEWQSIAQSLARLTVFAQEEMGELVSSETLFSFDDGGSMYLLLYVRREREQVSYIKLWLINYSIFILALHSRSSHEPEHC